MHHSVGRLSQYCGRGQEERGTGTEAASEKLKPSQALEQTKIRTKWRHWRRPLQRSLRNKLVS